ncbi:MAG: ABC transporter ATP-binding protein, partial [Clostridia bacterium]|nr:ABC transporter ATP-binding protein [Clostridia bacterium]
MPRITLTNVTKQWGKFTAVNNLSLDIEDGSFITLLGSSGCGKTTTLRMIAGLETPTRGEIRFDDKIMFSSEKNINVPAARREVGFLFQNYALWPHMTVVQNIAFGLETLKWKKIDIQARVDEMLGIMKIEPFAKRYPAEL